MTKVLEAFRPYDAGAGSGVTEDGWRKMARLWAPTGVVIDAANHLETFGDSSGLQAKVKSGEAWVRGHHGENQAQHTEGLDAVGGIPGGQTRIDRIVLRNDFVNNRIEIGHLTGTPGVTPSAPALTQSSVLWEIPLARITGISNATAVITAGMVTDERTFTGTDILVPQSATVATSQTVANPAYVDMATVGPVISVQTGTAILVALGATSSVPSDAFMGFAVTGATTLAAADSRATRSGNPAQTTGSRTFRVAGFTPGLNTLTAKYRQPSGTGTHENRDITAWPIP